MGLRALIAATATTIGVIVAVSACGGGRAELTAGDKKFCDTAATIAPSPANTSGVDLDNTLGDVANNDLQKLGSGVREKSKSEVKITAGQIVEKCSALGYVPRGPAPQPATSKPQALSGTLTVAGDVNLQDLTQYQPPGGPVLCVSHTADSVGATIRYQKSAEPGTAAAELTFQLPPGKAVAFPGDLAKAGVDKPYANFSFPSASLRFNSSDRTKGTASLAADRRSGSFNLEFPAQTSAGATKPGSVQISGTFSCDTP